MRVQSRGINSRKDLDLPDAQTSTTVRRHRADHWILIDCALLLAIGLMLIYSISPALADTTGVSGSYYVTREIIAIALSIIAFIVTTNQNRIMIPMPICHSFKPGKNIDFTPNLS